MQRSVFNYEEIEKLSIKAGIPFPSVKDINSLKADSLIECEKIGSGVFYWSFPSKAAQIVPPHSLSSTPRSPSASNRLPSSPPKSPL